MAVRSLTDPTVGIDNFLRFFQSPVAATSLVTTLRTALITTLGCLLVGYPYAYLMSVSRPRVAGLLLLLILIPSFLSLLVRTFAFQILLRDTGVINEALMAIGLIDDPLPLIRNEFSVIFGTTSLLIPFMILPIYAVMRTIDPDLSRAAAVLGASPFWRFRRVLVPLSLPGVAAGSLLVFVVALGAYITPAVLGDGRSTYLSEIVVFQVRHLAWGYGSAVAMILLAVTLLALLAASRMVRARDLFGTGIDR